MQIKTLIWLATFAACLTSTQHVIFGSPQSSANKGESNLAINATTLAVVRLDLQQVEASELLSFAKRISTDAIPDSAWPGFSALATPIYQQLQQTGASEILVVGGIAGVPSELPAIVLVRSKKNAEELAKTALAGMLKGQGYLPHDLAGNVVLCSAANWQRLQSSNGERPELAEALEESASTELSLTVAAPEYLAQAVASIWPSQLPAESPIQLSPKTLMNDVRSLTFSIDDLATPESAIVANCRSDEAAKRTLNTLLEVAESLKLQTPQAASNLRQASLVVSEESLVATVRSIVKSSNSSSLNMQDSNSLKQIVLAAWNFESEYGYIVPRYSVDESGKPLLSWRVHLLPFMDQQGLYEQFHLDEPWDSEHNLPLVKQIPFAYQSKEVPEGHTRMQLPLLADGGYWGSDEAEWRKVRDITDGTSRTAFAFQAPVDAAVPWTKPADFLVDPKSPLDSMLGGRERALVAQFDGSVSNTPESATNDSMRRNLTHSAGD